VCSASERCSNGKRVRERAAAVARVGVDIVRVHVAGHRALRVSDVEDARVGRLKAGDAGVGVRGVARKNEMLSQPQQSHVAPEAGVVLLAVHDERARARRRIGPRPEPPDVRYPALLVDDEVLHHVEVLRPGLEGQPGGVVAIGAAVVHVHVQVTAVPAAGLEIVE